MKLSRSFVWTPRGNHGGWKPVDAPTFDPGLPVHVAHDTLEHFTSDEAFHNELMAFGSILYGRAYTDPSGEMMRVAADDLSGFLLAQDFKVKHAVTRWDRPLKDVRAEKLVNEMLTFAYMKLLLEHGVPSPTAQSALKQSAPWIRLGYRLAERRWKGDHAALDKMFVDVFNRVADDHDRNVPHVGEHLTVTVDTEAHKVKLQRETA